MKITKISVYRKDLPYVGGEYRWGRGNAIRIAKTSVAVVETDAGLTGCGEFCPSGENSWLRTRKGSKPWLTFWPRPCWGKIRARSPIDAACWDILGQATDQSAWMLMGGKLTDGAPMYRVASQKPPAEMIAEMNEHRAAGYR